MTAAEDDELVDRNPVRIPKASTARVQNEQKPSPVDQIATIVDAMPEKLRLLSCLPHSLACAKGRSSNRRSDIDSSSGAIAVTRKIEKDTNPTAAGACTNCGRVIGPPKTAKGTRVVHLPPAFLPLLRGHLLGARHQASTDFCSPASERTT